MNDTAMFDDDGQDRFGRLVARADGTRLVILLEAAVWNAVDMLCRHERVKLEPLVEASCAFYPGESPASTLYRTTLGYWIKTAIDKGLAVTPQVASGVAGVEAILREARRRSQS